MSFFDWDGEVDWSGWDVEESLTADPPAALLEDLAAINGEMSAELLAIFCRGISLDPWQHAQPQDGRREWERVNRYLDDLIYDGLNLPREENR